MNTRIREHAPALRAWVRNTLLAVLVLAAAGSARAQTPAPAKTDGDSVKAAPAPAAKAAVAKAPAASVKSPAPATSPAKATVAPAQANPATAPAGTQAKPVTAPASTQAKPAAVPAGTQAKPASAPAKPATGVKGPPTKAAPGTPVPPTAKAQGKQTTVNATTVSKSTLVATRPLSSAEAAKTSSGVATSGTQQVKVPAAQLDEHITYQYNTLGRRDPFQSMLEGEFVGADVGGDAPPDIGGLTVVGIVWGDSDRFALCEDARGNSHILRKGDKVMNGVVQELKRDGVVMNLTVDDQSESVTIPLTRKGEKKNATR